MVSGKSFTVHIAKLVHRFNFGIGIKNKSLTGNTSEALP